MPASVLRLYKVTVTDLNGHTQQYQVMATGQVHAAFIAGAESGITHIVTIKAARESMASWVPGKRHTVDGSDEPGVASQH